jgi:hypothetical protein
MENQPIQRDGVWWHQRADESWLRWNSGDGTWEEHGSGPPPPAAPGEPVLPVFEDPVVAGFGGASLVTPVTPVFQAAGPANATLVPTPADPGRQRPGFGRDLAARFSLPKLPAPSSKVVVVAVAVVAALAGALVVKNLVWPASAVPSKEEVEAAFVPLKGLEYAPIPAQAENMMEAMVQAIPEADDIVGHIEMRQITRNGQMAAVAIALAVDPEQIPADTSVPPEFMAGFQASSGLTLQNATLAGAPVYEASGAAGSAIVWFDSDGMMLEVVGRDFRAARRIAKQLVVANS